jgi:FkbM family methyltransferase
VNADEVLRLHELRLVSTADSYDLRHASERKRSARELARLFFRLFKVVEPDLFVEAGAKDGRVSRRALRFLHSARAVAFEANPHTYDLYRADHPAGAGVEYLHLALSDRPGEVTFNVRQTEQGTPRADGHGSLMERSGDYGYDFESVTVAATTLDDFFADSDHERCALWVDVEGAAASVLGGGRHLLERAQVVMIELEDREFWEGAWRAPQVMRFLMDRGLVPIARDFEFKHQYNVVFVRDELLTDHLVRLRLTQHLSAARFPETGDG